MLEPSLGEDLLAIVGIPFVLWLTSLGTGLAIERIVRAELANALLLPLGLAGSIVLVYPLYALGSSDVLPVALLLVLSASGFVWARGGVRARLNPGLPGLAGLGAYILFMLPTLVAGHWLWLGYNFDNDTSVQFLLTASLKAHGTSMVPQLSTAGAVIDSYLSTAYPLGAHAELATLSGLLRTDPAVLYQGYLSSLAALVAVSVSAASVRLAGRGRALLLGFAAAGANLFLQYAFQGNIKEIATATMTVAACVLAGEAVRARRGYSGVALTAVPLAATLCTYGVAGAPYVLALVGGCALQLIVFDRRLPRPSWIGPTLLGAALVPALSVPAVAQAESLFIVAQGVVGNTNPTGNVLGQLARPLPLSQISGVWLDGDYRIPVVASPAALLTVIATVAILVLLVPGLVSSIARREPGPLFAVVMTGLVLWIVMPRVTPYAAGKVLAMGSPVIVWVAGVGLCALSWRRIKPLVSVVGVALAVAIVISDVLAYHEDQVSPTSRMLAIEQVGDRFAGRGPVLFNESDEFIKYFARAATTIAPFDSITPLQVDLIDPEDIFDQFFDLDQEKLQYIESFPLIVTRRSPIVSRPPANYRLVYSNDYYEGWKRTHRPVVLAHLPLQSTWAGSAVPGCPSVKSLLSHAPRGSELVQAVTPPSTGFEILGATSRPSSWLGTPYGEATTIGPGYVHEVVDVPVSGVYRAWVQGSFSRPIEVSVDGRAAGSVDGLSGPSQWERAGLLHLTAGRHVLAIRRGGGRITPGDGTPLSYVGYVTLRKQGPEVLRAVPIAHWRSLCGTPADWIELVRP